ncbi:fatty acyl-CoA synthetase family protein, putative [Babesia bigemina]|uniref:Long-chain-fatty-acid--CoA ligase n=1 Tax=Babesia bigemina TaxID=5866 RepID=A0A061DDR5_BABBI|nr:fatty acyl-CoA synthetase family protein, putative [Babesia bigemina]CDR96500.1 fatty acyl-CoA synthetase family protein, putative [Babesia bigemina]|eukprot:XP_012768686.1 fatty acyl-CoA synthetase family protein, putative [Babesia bigemina]
MYSLPVPGTEEEGFSAVYRCPLSVDKVLSYKDYFDGNIATGWDIFQHGLKQDPDAPCLGTRVRKDDGALGEYAFKSYREVEALVQRFGSGLQTIAGIEKVEVNAPEPVEAMMIGIYAPNSVEWLICEQTANAFGYTIVPIYDTIGEESILHILQNSDINVVVCDYGCAQKLMRAMPKAHAHTIKAVIVIGTEKVAPEGNDVEVLLFDEVLARGDANLIPFSPAKPEQVNTISYTSGTSGIPKGVILTQGQIASLITVVNQTISLTGKVSPEAVKCYLSYLPLAHMYERLYINSCLIVGGKIGLYSGDVRNILEDLETLKPTVFVSVPRLYFRIHDKVFSNVSRKHWIIQAIFNMALKAKLRRIRTTGNCKHAFWDRFVFKKFPALFGGNVEWMMTGSAPLSPLTYDRMRAIFGTQLLAGYGLTETAAGAVVNMAGETDTTHVGGIIPSLEFRLKSLPDLEYSVKDPNPRGELMLRGSHVTCGYFRNPDATAEAIQDGWLLTGDIAELLPNGAIKIIDRRKHIFKLVQGEYIMPEKLEAVLIGCTLLSQAFVTGKSTEIYPVAIVVPDEVEVQFWAKDNGHSELSLQEICKLPEFKEAIMKQMNKAYDESGVKGFERCKHIYVEPEPFSIGNDMLTTTNKLRRHNAKKKYSAIIDELCAAGV